MRAVQERWPELRDQGAGIENLGLGTENSVQSPDHCSMARCSCSCHCLPNDPRARSPDHPHDRCSRLALLCISMSVWSVRTKLLSTRLLCYKRSMAKWFRRKGKAPSDSESTGKIGQAKDPKSSALQPSYTDDFGQATTAPAPPASPAPIQPASRGTEARRSELRPESDSQHEHGAGMGERVQQKPPVKECGDEHRRRRDRLPRLAVNVDEILDRLRQFHRYSTLFLGTRFEILHSTS